MKKRAGEFITNLTEELQYRSFSPKPLPPEPPVELKKSVWRRFFTQTMT